MIFFLRLISVFNLISIERNSFTHLLMSWRPIANVKEDCQYPYIAPHETGICLLLKLIRKDLIGFLKLNHVLIIDRTESSHGRNENGVVSIVLIKAP